MDRLNERFGQRLETQATVTIREILAIRLHNDVSSDRYLPVWLNPLRRRCAATHSGVEHGGHSSNPSPTLCEDISNVAINGSAGASAHKSFSQ